MVTCNWISNLIPAIYEKKLSVSVMKLQDGSGNGPKFYKVYFNSLLPQTSMNIYTNDV